MTAMSRTGLAGLLLVSLVGAVPSPAMATLSLADPVLGDGLRTSGFGPRVDPFTGRTAFHHGLDIAGRFGTPIFAAGDGRVVAVERRGPYGNFIEIEHEGGVHTRYAQLQSFETEPGALVKAGQLIARMGSTGRSTGPHLHFEVLIGGTAVDPNPLVRWVKRGPMVPD
jgi:murein DD-endopeptidase MepM/ murein hydrolase activator NlpD